MQKNKKNGEKTSTIGVVFLCAAILAFSVVIGRTVVPGFEYKEQNADRESEQTSSASSDAGQFAVDAPYIGEPSKKAVPLASTSDWNLLLVNAWNRIPDDFSVELTQLMNGQPIDERAYPDLQDMMDAMRAEGLSPFICSSYRTAGEQEILFNNKVDTHLAQGYSQADAEQRRKNGWLLLEPVSTRPGLQLISWI